MLYIELAPSDQERLGVEGLLEIDVFDLPIDDAVALDEIAGWDYDDLLAEMGKLARKPAEGQPRERPAPRAVKAFTWLALRRAGKEVRWTELTFNLRKWKLVAVGSADEEPAPEGEQPQDPTGAPASSEGPAPGNSSRRTRPRSRTSTASASGKPSS